ncbi:MAG TPA: hypothetical protein VJI15_03230 [Candidatus Nanoarchaeia archaeon]|nr:hypothetical protein [Candidatus Nanoarchaeia archaeon]
MTTLAIVGGSGAKGVVEALGLEAQVESVQVFNNGHASSIASPSTPLAGPPSLGFKARVDYLHFYSGETEVYFVLRHGQNHDDLPAKLDQRGIIFFLKYKGVKDVILTSATGSLDTTIPLVDHGGMVINSGTFRGFGYHGISFNDPQNPHAVLAQPYDKQLRQLLLNSAHEVPRLRACDGGLYIQNEGNSFESPAEIADLYCRLDAPAARVRDIELLLRLSKSSENAMVRSSLEQERDRYQRLGKQLTVKYAQVSMNAVRETILGLEKELRIALVSFPVNYGAGLVPDEQVDHDRTRHAIAHATGPYIVPFLRAVIENAPQYLQQKA